MKRNLNSELTSREYKKCLKERNQTFSFDFLSDMLIINAIIVLSFIDLMMNYVHFLHSHLAGFSFAEGVFVFDQLVIGADLQLVFEPENRYDANAVALYFKNTKIGYIPRANNKEIAKFLEAGYNDLLIAKINRISPEEHPENQIGIAIFLKKKKR